MKNLTLKLDDEVYQMARIRAAQEGTSISAMVRDFLIRRCEEAGDPQSQRIAALDELYRLARERGEKRAVELKPMSREEIYAERPR